MRGRCIAVLVLCSVVGLGAQSSAQTTPKQADAFDVASIRLNVSGWFVAFRRLPGGRLEAVNLRLRDLIVYAYGLERPQTVEGAFPVLDQRFNVTAVSGKDWPTSSGPGPFNTALQRLLAER